MKKFALLAVATLGLATGAHAQDAVTHSAQPYVGLSGGYHSFGDGGTIYGVLAGVDVPVGETLTLGVEGNYHLGTNSIDSEYGVAARLGFPIGATSQLFVKGGYQWVDIDLPVRPLAPTSVVFDDTFGDYLVGVGGEFGIGDSPARIRVGVDTIAFDTVRATAGVIFKF